MAAKTYKAHALVLRKTKLGEKDLIVTMLDDEGMLVKGVAKGARKPGGSFSARLELFGEVDVLMAKGRSLDVVCDAKMVGATAGLTWGLEQSACAAPLAELLCNISQPDLPQPRVFALSQAALQVMSAPDREPAKALAISSAALWKVMSQSGFRPSFSQCVSCGSSIGEDQTARQSALSVADGGVVCSSCRRPADAIVVDRAILRWCEALITLRYAEILEADCDVATLMETLQLARLWARAHTGRDLRSLDFLFTCGLILS